MKDMFVKYDNDSEEKNMPPHTLYKQSPKILESVDNISIVCDALGNEIGIKVKHNTAFNLYFYLDGWTNGVSLDTLVLNSTIVFKVYSFRHKLVLEKELSAAALYDTEFNYIEFPITAEEASALDIDSYKLNVSLVWDDGSYELYTEADGLLIIR